MREFKKLPLELFIGYDIEQNSRVIELDASEMVEKYPSGILQLVCKRPGEETTYIAPSFEQDGGTLRWTLTSYDVEKAGQGLAIVALVDTSEESVKVLASHKIRTGIEEGLHFRDAETVDPEDSLIARVLAAVSQAQAYAQDAAAALEDVQEEHDQAISDIETKGQETLDSIPSDYTALSGDVSDLKSALNGLSGIATTWQDGYISNADGQLYPPTADAQKASDFIPVIKGSFVKAVIQHSASKYMFASISAYDSNKNYISRLAIIDGSTATAFEISTVIENQNVSYIRISYASYNDDLGTLVYVYSNIRNEINDIISPTIVDIDKIRELDQIRFQYLDTSKWESGYYNWNQSQTALQKNDGGANWFCMKVVDVPAGTYRYNKFCSLAFSFIENQTTGEIVKLSDIGVTETNNGTVTINYDFNLWLSITLVYFDKTITMFASGGLPSEYVYGWYKDTTASNYVNAQGQTVWIVGNGYIPTIQAACDAASPNDIIFVRVGVYTEQVSIWNKKLHIIGENKANTILIDHSGAYNTPPLEMSLGSLSNMTIIEDGTQPTLQPGESGYNAAYCLHIEWTPPANEVFQIENCDFINYVHSPLGCGLYQDYTVHFKDCTFRCEATDEGNMERGSFYFHTNIQPNVTGQKIIAENCIISSAGQRWAVLLGVPAGANNTGSAEARFSGCTIWNDNVGTADSIAYFDQSGGADVLKVVHSCGNTVDVLNNW